MSKGYLVFYKAELTGVLENKDEYKRFKEQRFNNSNYDYVKLPWKEILRVVSESNLGSLQPVILHGMEDIVVFANEYQGLIEDCYTELEGTLDLFLDLMTDTKDYLRLSEEEKCIINGNILVISKLINSSINNGVWFESAVEGLNLRPFVEGWLESFTNDEEY